MALAILFGVPAFAVILAVALTARGRRFQASSPPPLPGAYRPTDPHGPGEK